MSEVYWALCCYLSWLCYCFCLLGLVSCCATFPSKLLCSYGTVSLMEFRHVVWWLCGGMSRSSTIYRSRTALDLSFSQGCPWVFSAKTDMPVNFSGLACTSMEIRREAVKLNHCLYICDCDCVAARTWAVWGWWGVFILQNWCTWNFHQLDISAEISETVKLGFMCGGGYWM